MLQQKGKKKVTVDAICGSGYVAGAKLGENFRSRILLHENATWVIVGGWNDEQHMNVAHAVQGALKATTDARR